MLHRAKEKTTSYKWPLQRAVNDSHMRFQSLGFCVRTNFKSKIIIRNVLSVVARLFLKKIVQNQKELAMTETYITTENIRWFSEITYCDDIFNSSGLVKCKEFNPKLQGTFRNNKYFACKIKIKKLKNNAYFTQIFSVTPKKHLLVPIFTGSQSLISISALFHCYNLIKALYIHRIGLYYRSCFRNIKKANPSCLRLACESRKFDFQGLCGVNFTFPISRDFKNNTTVSERVTAFDVQVMRVLEKPLRREGKSLFQMYTTFSILKLVLQTNFKGLLRINCSKSKYTCQGREELICVSLYACSESCIIKIF
ncbi:hypothetical protein EGR_03506 [Echinococcus granulosus]|uniref:Uncharacterized protein n=1 Tax=Echinococcus granulosus TaxID=6210 RepID=W6UTJ1_ECHGR|nr:hypothetical protein EGR_03506 [Echinococcus granulosus]EUB61692.1 hypothetical protein EGR_03506 [Echinococcus granulosus]